MTEDTAGQVLQPLVIRPVVGVGVFRPGRSPLLHQPQRTPPGDRIRRGLGTRPQSPTDLLDTDLAKDPSSLRPAGLSGQLSAGVAPQTVAQRAGHSVEVLLRVYARFIHDTDDDANRRISEWLQRWG
ncbi:hypothetical protein HUT13_09685 [Streptomyces harbinensis]|uniref:hypothetical protein n=1 Tax=Streptomyces harbinensis TaxID=1176198 RepID=UPI001591BE00|nr:hypothetical protein [Streptomyces harbinensis]QKV69025.1 hypothetical protein HUT13_09685 [Streptomyces harbinensis]